MVNGAYAAPGMRHKPQQYAFPSQADSDTLSKEIEEFFSYIEAPQIVENRQSWEDWCASPQAQDTQAGANGVESEGDGGEGASKTQSE